MFKRETMKKTIAILTLAALTTAQLAAKKDQTKPTPKKMNPATIISDATTDIESIRTSLSSSIATAGSGQEALDLVDRACQRFEKRLSNTTDDETLESDYSFDSHIKDTLASPLTHSFREILIKETYDRTRAALDLLGLDDKAYNKALNLLKKAADRALKAIRDHKTATLPNAL